MSQLSVVDTVMISGHFDPFHDGHLSYIKQAMAVKTFVRALICMISSDAQLLKKKGKVNIPISGRLEIVDTILKGLGCKHVTLENEWDTETTLVAEALRFWKPDIFFRGGDKTLETMPPEEKRVCDELGIVIVHATLERATHGAGMAL